MTVWTELDANVQIAARGGLWLKVSPQLRTAGGPGFSELRRLAIEADLLPRAHWNLGLSYYRDHNHTFEVNATTLLLQLHAYL